ncbi:hypothetical protein D0T49_06990 [Paludibacter sp. 221]|uniref:hypothetical protein n=1 Tax=Paludibacter sp. 221 TaxID=2302939 RepID=UPI0013D08C08|nr:hypothetical protein [Paludibacter sp. 221]NDV46790.1 hypothetical protein [Paludibacter sp. 221]
MKKIKLQWILLAILSLVFYSCEVGNEPEEDATAIGWAEIKGGNKHDIHTFIVRTTDISSSFKSGTVYSHSIVLTDVNRSAVYLQFACFSSTPEIEGTYSDSFENKWESKASDYIGHYGTMVESRLDYKRGLYFNNGGTVKISKEGELYTIKINVECVINDNDYERLINLEVYCKAKPEIKE